MRRKRNLKTNIRKDGPPPFTSDGGRGAQGGKNFPHEEANRLPELVIIGGHDE